MKSRVYNNLAFDQYHVLSDWHHLALLNLFELPEISHCDESLSLRLNINIKKVKESIHKLLRLKMIEKKDERYIRTSTRYQTSEDLTNSAINKYHQETLILSENALKKIAPEFRDFSSVVLKINPKNLIKVKKIIREFQDDICDLVENDNPEEIYHLNVHLYPLTIKKK